MSSMRRRASHPHPDAGILAAAFTMLAFVGCGSQRGTLEGRVTYDGVPVSDGYVMLFPTDGNYRGSSSVRIVDGRYRIGNIVPGERRVSLDNLTMRSPPAAAPTPVAAGPAAYPTTITVEPGRHTLDFSLGTHPDEPDRRRID